MRSLSVRDYNLFTNILLVFTLFNLIYASLFLIYGAPSAAFILFLSHIVFGGMTFLSLKLSNHNISRYLIIISGIIFIVLVSNIFSGEASSQFYYLAIVLLPLILFEGSRKKTFFIFILILLLWRIQKTKLHAIPFLSSPELPVELFFYLNFLGAAFLTLALVKLFLDQWDNIKQELIKINIRQDYILEGAGLGAWDWWLDDNRVIFDRRWCEMLGLDLENTPMHLSTWDSRVHPDDKEQVYAQINNYLQGKTSIYESFHRLRHSNGEWVWILDRGRVSEYDSNGKAIRFTGTHLDITISKEIEAQLEEAQRVAKIGSWSFDVKTKKITWSKQMFIIFNENIEAGAPSLEAHLATIHPEDQELWISTVQQGLIDGEPYRFRYRTINPAGEIIWLEGMGQAHKNLNSEIIRLSGTCQDITSLVAAEESNKLERAKLMQSSKLSSLGEMSAGIAHEINNPLAIISGMLHILHQEKSDYLTAVPIFESIDKSVERIAKIVRGLKKFSRTSEKSNLQLNCLNQIIDESLILLNIRAKQVSVGIKFEASEQLFAVCDDMEIEQVIINLVNNSFDAVKNLSEKWVVIKLFEKNNYIYLQVKDSGDRIEEKYVKKLFEPFFTTKKVGEGTGLGLSIVKGILDDHDASIELLISEPQTCFEIKFKKPESI